MTAVRGAGASLLSLVLLAACTDSTNPLRPLPASPVDAGRPDVVRSVDSGLPGDAGREDARPADVGFADLGITPDGSEIPPICSDDNWCWAHPTTGGAHLHAVWAFGRGEAWAVGEAGTILRIELDRPPVRVSSGVEVTLHAIHGSGEVVMAAGDGGTLLRIDGGVWTSTLSGSLNLEGVWVAPGGEFAVAVGQAGTLLEYRSGAWNRVELNVPNDLHGVWGSGPERCMDRRARGPCPF